MLLGVVPHGNLLAIGLLLLILSLKINHAMAALTAVGATCVATRLDPFSHRVGDYVLTHPNVNEAAVAVWQLPLVPWTDLNNTVVMGSFLIGVGALVPVFAITYPVFRYFAPTDAVNDLPKPKPSDEAQAADGQTHEVVMIDQRHDQVSAPHLDLEPTTPGDKDEGDQGAGVDVEFVEVEQDEDSNTDVPDNQIAVETRIDVIRMQDHRDASSKSASQEADASPEEQQPMDEALNYLLRQLRDSQQRKAA